jgi:hypothetical protein
MASTQGLALSVGETSHGHMVKAQMLLFSLPIADREKLQSPAKNQPINRAENG